MHTRPSNHLISLECILTHISISKYEMLSSTNPKRVFVSILPYFSFHVTRVLFRWNRRSRTWVVRTVRCWVSGPNWRLWTISFLTANNTWMSSRSRSLPKSREPPYYRLRFSHSFTCCYIIIFLYVHIFPLAFVWMCMHIGGCLASASWRKGISSL